MPHGRAAVLEAVGCGNVNRGERASFLLPCEPVDRLALSSVPRVVRPARWRRMARHALANAVPPAIALRAAARAHLTLIPFQLEPALAVARGDGCRLLIADTVGMGKTVQAGLIVAEALQRRPESRILVVAPAGLREQWREELQARFGLDAAVLDAAAVARAAAQLPSSINPWSVHPLAITSIDYVKRPEVIRSLEALIWDVVIFDEAHGLAGPSDRSTAAQSIGGRARTLVMLTATPHSGDDEAFLRLCEIGELTDRYPLMFFRRTRALMDVTAPRRSSLVRVRPTPAEAAMHHALMDYARSVWTQSPNAGSAGARLAMSVLIRRACSSAASLARSIHRRLSWLTDPPSLQAQPGLPFSDEEPNDDEPLTELCAPGLADPADERLRLTRLLSLAQDAMGAESKLRALRRLLLRVREPAIVFTEYRDTLQHLARAMADLDVVHVHGGLRRQDRVDALRRFTHGNARLLLATDAASEGLNLHQRCRLVINFELPWTPLRLEQRAGRVDRIGQSRRVHALHLVAAGTGEETVVTALDKRVIRMRGALDALTRPPDEQEIARFVIDGTPLAEGRADAYDGAGIVTPDLRLEARREAERIALSRALSIPGADVLASDRPAITLLKRRPRASHPCAASPLPGGECFWLFNVSFVDASGRPVYDAALALGAHVARKSGRTSSEIRSLLDPRQPAVNGPATAAQVALTELVRRILRQPIQLWLARERALIETLRARHSRLTTGLLQLGLFDRREERLTAAQAAILEEALSASTTRLSELAGWEHLRVDACQLLFGIARIT